MLDRLDLLRILDGELSRTFSTVTARVTRKLMPCTPCMCLSPQEVAYLCLIYGQRERRELHSVYGELMLWC
jgi:hypothetical protein